MRKMPTLEFMLAISALSRILISNRIRLLKEILSLRPEVRYGHTIPIQEIKNRKKIRIQSRILTSKSKSAELKMSDNILKSSN